MIMTEKELSAQTTEDLMQRKHELENGLAVASTHGVEVPEELLNELEETQKELARRIDCNPAN